MCLESGQNLPLHLSQLLFNLQSLHLSLQALSVHKQNADWPWSLTRVVGVAKKRQPQRFPLAALDVFSRLPVALTSDFFDRLSPPPHAGTLNAFLKQKGQTTSDGPVWSLSGNQGDRWKEAKVSIHPTASFQVRAKEKKHQINSI